MFKGLNLEPIRGTTVVSRGQKIFLGLERKSRWNGWKGMINDCGLNFKLMADLRGSCKKLLYIRCMRLLIVKFGYVLSTESRPLNS